MGFNTDACALSKKFRDWRMSVGMESVAKLNCILYEEWRDHLVSYN